MSTVLGSSSDLSQEGVVDLEDKKNDDHSTRKRPYNTESKPVGDLCGNKGDSPRKGPLVMSDSESAELVCEFANNSASGQKGNPIVRALPQNTPLSDFLKAEAEAEAEAEAGDLLPKVYPLGYVPPKGYAMVCQLCGVVNCRTPGLSRPVMLSCCFCKEYGTHYSLDCPVKKFRGPPMPERPGVVDLEVKKNDDHSTRKRPYNTESKPVGDLCGNKGDSPRKRPLVMSDSESAELVCEFANNSASGQKGNPIVRALPQNTPLSDFLKAEAEAEAEAEAGDPLPKVYPLGYVPPKGYAMVCQLCGVVNCRTPGLSRPMKMSCCFCKESGTHYSLDCKKFRGPPMPERYSCFYWKPAI